MSGEQMIKHVGIAFTLISALAVIAGLVISSIHVSYDARAALALEKLATGCP